MRLLIFATALVAVPASAQLSFSADTYTPTAFDSGLTSTLEGAVDIYSVDGAGIGAVSEGDAAQIDALLGQTGSGQTWDFTGLAYLDEPLGLEGQRLEDPAGLPGADLFPTATVAYRVNVRGRTGPGDVEYTYARVSDSAFVALGSFREDAGAGQSLRHVYVPDGLLNATFPLALGAAFEDGSAYDASPRTPAGPDSVEVAVEVVGAGTLVLPSGRYDALMVRRTQTDFERDGSRVIVYDALTTHEWVTAEGVAALAVRNEVGPTQRTVRRAQYQAPRVVTDLEDVPAALSVAAFPNPTASRATVRVAGLEGGPARAVVFDALGRKVAVLHDGPLAAGDHAFAITGLAPGAYVVRVEAGGRVGTARVVVAR